MAEGKGVGNISISRVDGGAGLVVGDGQRRSEGVKGLTGLSGGGIGVAVDINSDSSCDIDGDVAFFCRIWCDHQGVNGGANGGEGSRGAVGDGDFSSGEIGYGF